MATYQIDLPCDFQLVWYELHNHIPERWCYFVQIFKERPPVFELEHMISYCYEIVNNYFKKFVTVFKLLNSGGRRLVAPSQIDI